MLPFYGKSTWPICHGRVIGLSKIPRLVDMFARRLQVQERLTQELGADFQEVIDPRGWG